MLKFLGPILLLFFLCHCRTNPVKSEAAQAPQSYKNEILRAQELGKTNPQAAIANLDQLLSSYPENNLSDDALMLLGNLLVRTNQNEAALRAYSRILNSKYSSPLDGPAILKKAKLEMALGKQSQALATLNHIQNYRLVNQDSLGEIEQLRSKLLFKNKNYVDFLYSAKNLIATTNDPQEKRKTFKQALDVLKIKVVGSENKRILEEPELSLFHPQAALNLIEYKIEDGHPEEAAALLETYSPILENPPYKSLKDEMLKRTQVYSSPNLDTIGVLLPLSGRYQAVGQSILRGLQYSLDVWGASTQGQGFKLSILDSEADPNQTAYAVDELMTKDKPVALIGGLVSKSADALLAKAKEYRVPTLVLSQKEGLTKNSKYGFQNSQSMSAYADLVAEIAKDLDFKKAAVLQSKHDFSKKYADAFTKSFNKLGGEVIRVLVYDVNERRSLPNTVKKLVHLDSKVGREAEYSAAVTAWKKSGKSRGATSIPPIEDLLKPDVDFDVLFVADGAKNGGLVASTLAYYDVEGLPLIGTHLWNDVSLLERGQRFVENAIFASSYYEPTILSSSCGQDYMRKFQEPIGPYVHKGIEAGLIFKNMFQNFSIDSRSSLLSALQRTSSITHDCLPTGLINQDHNFYSPLQPLIVKDKSILVFDPKKYANPTDQSPKF